jgi:hypothetical protein
MVWQRLPADKSASISHIDEEAGHRVPEARRRVVVVEATLVGTTRRLRRFANV